jgi:hypothetical protein
MAGKGEVTHTFRTSPEFDEWISPKVARLDRTKSEIIRVCILLALPAICANPSLIDHVRLEDTRKDIACQS